LKAVSLIVLFICLFLNMLPCLGDRSNVEVTDEAGKSVVVPSEPRVVCRSAASAETVYALNASHLMAGRADSCNIPPAIEMVPSLGSTSGEVAAEAVLATGEELVISGVPPISGETEEQLRDACVPVSRRAGPKSTT
jgi:ABC-type hemin transport system substrate-binding protein